MYSQDNLFSCRNDLGQGSNSEPHLDLRRTSALKIDPSSSQISGIIFVSILLV